jgi:hypothetical protein
MTGDERSADYAQAGGDADTTGDRPADVEIGGSLRADQVTFHEPVRVRTRTDPEQAEREEDHVRENLPSGDPSTGRAYRDVYVRRRVGVRLGVDLAEDLQEGRGRGD